MHTTDDDRTGVLVTGASRGIGAEIARRLADEGHLVFAGVRRTGVSPTSHVAVVDAVGCAPDGGLVPVPLDVTDGRSIAAAVERVSQVLAGRRLLAVVNNAGVLDAGPLELADIEQVERQLRTNVVGPLAVIQAFLPLLRAGRGRIVNVGSINAFLPLPFWGVYSASKAALVALSDALRLELAPCGIPVSLLTLGAFATDIRSDAHTAWAARATGEIHDRYHPAREAHARLVATLDATAGEPARVAEAVVGILHAVPPPARCDVGDDVEDLLALAAQTIEARDAVLSTLLRAQ
jgi:NAD(P)-dependent dehydrogenase (short-subunit alcohol dehydrogenase family)